MDFLPHLLWNRIAQVKSEPRVGSDTSGATRRPVGAPVAHTGGLDGSPGGRPTSVEDGVRRQPRGVERGGGSSRRPNGTVKEPRGT